jgi:hypothetical protein
MAVDVYVSGGKEIGGLCRMLCYFFTTKQEQTRKHGNHRSKKDKTIRSNQVIPPSLISLSPQSKHSSRHPPCPKSSRDRTNDLQLSISINTKKQNQKAEAEAKAEPKAKRKGGQRWNRTNELLVHLETVSILPAVSLTATNYTNLPLVERRAL